MKNNILFFIFLSFFLVGCGTKREYFSPKKEEIIEKVSYNKNLHKKIAYVTANGATLKDGSVITKDGFLDSIKLDKNEKFLTLNENKIISSNLDGTLKIRNLDGNLVFEHKFPVQILSANLNGDYLALVSVNNTIYLMSLSSKVIYLEEKSNMALAYDSRMSKPIFPGRDIVLYPMLDGRVVIAHLPSKSLIQDAFLSNEPFFNNVIYLDVVGDSMYAATNTTFALISPTINKKLKESVRDIFRYENKIYLFRKDGIAKVFDLNLNKLNEKKFKFAIFSGIVAKGDNLYIFEKTGYLIKTDLNLENEQIFKLDGDLDELSFVGKNAFYHDDKYLEIR